MSAYIVDRAHIDALVDAAVGHRGIASGIVDPEMGHVLDYSDADRIGTELWSENVRSIQYRYPDVLKGGEYPGPCDFTPDQAYEYRFTRPDRHLEPVEVLKAIDGLDYQSCEHPEWEQSWSFRFLTMLRMRTTHELPGYAGAAWEVTR